MFEQRSIENASIEAKCSNFMSAVLNEACGCDLSISTSYFSFSKDFCRRLEPSESTDCSAGEIFFRPGSGRALRAGEEGWFASAPPCRLRAAISSPSSGTRPVAMTAAHLEPMLRTSWLQVVVRRVGTRQTVFLLSLSLCVLCCVRLKISDFFCPVLRRAGLREV